VLAPQMQELIDDWLSMFEAVRIFRLWIWF
jgi:hypothetical protein